MSYNANHYDARADEDIPLPATTKPSSAMKILKLQPP